MQDPFGGATAMPPRSYNAMSMRDLKCALHMPFATQSRFNERGEETVGRLAPYAPVDLYRVDDIPNCPMEWTRSDQACGIASYFVRAQIGHMCWFDLRINENDAHHVAAIISAQGINAITGQKMTPPVRLEQYDTICPIHHVPFEREKHCASCEFEWPSQNYIATTSVSPGRFWRDGFRGKNGKTREFLFTEQVERGIAAHVIGDERVNAFGVALFRSQNPKPHRPVIRRRGALLGSSTRGCEESLEVGAGALVQQDVERDRERLDFWKSTPDALFIVYYVGDEQFQTLVNVRGQGSPTGSEGFLGGKPVGNP